MMINPNLNQFVNNNLNSVSIYDLITPFLFFIIFSVFVITKVGFNELEYIEIQKELFFTINKYLSSFPMLQINLTHLGNPLVLLPFASIFIIYAPKIWKCIILSTLISALVSFTFKSLIDVPRPAAYLDLDSFMILGKTHLGFASLPSGHSISTFTFIVLILYSLIPQNYFYKFIWTLILVCFGVSIVFSRVAVGAHYPFDVVFGSLIGVNCALISILISKQIKWPPFLINKKHTKLIVLTSSIWIVFLIYEIFKSNLFIFYVSIGSLLLTSVVLLKNYAKI